METQDSSKVKEISTQLLTEDQNLRSPGETFLSNSNNPQKKKKKNFCKKCFSKLFCCFFLEEINPEEELEQKQIINENPIDNPHKILHSNLVKSSVDLKEDKVEKNYSEDSNGDGSSLNKISEEKNNSDENFKIIPLLMKKNSKKAEKKKVSCEECVKDYPINNLFFLANSNRTAFLLAKITQKYLTITEKEKSGSSNPLPSSSTKSDQTGLKKDKNCFTPRYYDNPINIFSLYDKGIKLDTDNWEKACPERLAKYIAKRAKNSHFHVILDAFCGIGGNAIQFAKECPFVIGVDNCEKQINYLKHNASIYGLCDKIDGIISDFLTFEIKKTDLVFLNPATDFKKNENEKFSPIKHIKPDIFDILKKTWSISHSFMILLPKFFDFSELPSIFSTVIPHDYESEKHSLEIELIYINNQVEYVLIHFGKSCNVAFNEELEFLHAYVNKDNHSKISNNIKFLRYITKKLGIQKVISVILEAENQQNLESETLFQSFLDFLRFEDLLTIEEQQEYLMDYIKHTSILTPTEVKPKFLAANVDQSPISFENPLLKKMDTDNFSFVEQKKVSPTSHPSFPNSPNFEILKNRQNDNKMDLQMKIKEKSFEKIMLTPDDSQINKNPKSSNLTHKSDDNLPSYYSGKLFEASAKDHFIDAQLENEMVGNDCKYNSLQVPIKKSWSERFPKKSSCFEERYDDDAIDDERRESQSYQ